MSRNLQFYAQPYRGDNGFYFRTAREFRRRTRRHPGFDRHPEEYEIQYLDGSPEETAFFRRVPPVQSNIVELLRFLDEETPDSIRAVVYLVDQGYSFAEAKKHADRITMHEGTVEDYALELVRNMGVDNIGDHYFDYASLGRDLDINGDDTQHLQQEIDVATRQIAQEDPVKVPRTLAKQAVRLLGPSTMLNLVGTMALRRQHVPVKDVLAAIDELLHFANSVRSPLLQEYVATAQRMVPQFEILLSEDVRERRQEIADSQGEIDRLRSLENDERGEEWIERVYGGLKHVPMKMRELYFDWKLFEESLELSGQVDTFSYVGTDYVVEL